jgi:hypothetical protein
MWLSDFNNNSLDGAALFTRMSNNHLKSMYRNLAQDLKLIWKALKCVHRQPQQIGA